MANILVIYSSRYGQTARIVGRLEQGLAAAGHSVETLRAERLDGVLPLSGVDAVVVVAPVYYGRHPRAILRLLRTHRDRLNRLPTGFVSVCGSIGSEAESYVARTLRETDWRPTVTSVVRGGVAYTRYHPLLRWVMRRINRKVGGPTDTSRDHDLTDWAQVDRIGANLAGLAPVSAGTASPAR